MTPANRGQRPRLQRFPERFPRGPRIPPMKTPALLSKAIKSIVSIAERARHIPDQIFGNISWRPPRWMSRAGEDWNRLERTYPRLIAPAIIAIFSLACAGAWTWNWYSHLPKPRRVTVKIVPVEVTRLEKELKFPRLVVYFSESAARLEDLKKASLQDVRLEHQVAGGWRWNEREILGVEQILD